VTFDKIKAAITNPAARAIWRLAVSVEVATVRLYHWGLRQILDSLSLLDTIKAMTTSKFSPIPDKETFYARVWDLVRKVPAGKVVTYGQVAGLIEPPEGLLTRQYLAFGPRWVGSAMAHCPKDVPWHRVINAQGKISQRASGSHLRQQKRLEAEGVVFDSAGRIDLGKYGWEGYAG
jgi:methylated-DNA-protein-cysteine methyltransferase-like protein